MFQFTYGEYENLIAQIRDQGYEFTNFESESQRTRICVLRHDVDLSPKAALELAQRENKMGVCSTYYVLVNTGFYNVFHVKTNQILREIIALGHTIGLHFDAKPYSGLERDQIVSGLQREVSLLEIATDIRIKSFSIHRPSTELIESRLEIPGLINTYNDTFFRQYKYISDSRMRWRTQPEKTITEGHSQLQILTHPIWYSESPQTIQEVLQQFTHNEQQKVLYRLDDSITDFRAIMKNTTLDQE